MTDKSFEEGVCIGMLFGVGGNTKKPIIKPLSVTKNGKYTAPPGVDGYSPVDVEVPDRYDEGFNDGYDDGYAKGVSDGCDIYKNLYEKEKGGGETVNDLEGNPIDNAIVTNNLDNLNNYLRATEFKSGDSVTVTNLGADVSIRFEFTTNTYPTGYTQHTMHIYLRNVHTGQEQHTWFSKSATSPPGQTGSMKITNLSFSDDYGAMSASIDFFIMGTYNQSDSKTAYAKNVGGTVFGTPDTDYAYS